ncbi:MAG: UDP-N-acetylmuramate dehydrogenase [Candidatus Pacebacteria bacterium]|jgi:UDP-N-acetylmuramate dehydrogenase|nr:UDP-N-acetylmuramate dehydrogenase [Candidatus Paceibacterota bacterium]
MLEKEENALIGSHTSFGVGGRVAYLVRIKTEAAIPRAIALAKQEGLPLYYLGQGSNTLFGDGLVAAVVLKIEISGFTVASETDVYADILIGAGENWDSVVKQAIDRGLSGIEAMSAIPGTSGATPFQNVGAYGQEIKDTLISVRAYDTKTEAFVSLSNAECKFGYRDSVFRSGEKNRYVITSITLRLSKKPPCVPEYPGVQNYFAEKGIAVPTLHDIREAIIAIRSTKLPDPKRIRNAGSFFKNPIVSTMTVIALKQSYPDIVSHPTADGMMKLSAGWLIERAGLKGCSFGTVGIYEKNALVLINKGDATFADVMAAKEYVIEKVKDSFGIELEPEPICIQ